MSRIHCFMFNKKYHTVASIKRFINEHELKLLRPVYENESCYVVRLNDRRQFGCFSSVLIERGITILLGYKNNYSKFKDV